METTVEPERRGGRRWGLVVVLGWVLGIWLWVTVPLALGQKTLFYRDVFTLHFPLKAFGAAELAAGRIPAFNTAWGLGQPFRGNPQTLAFYPDNLLYLALPFWSAFNLHYALHWLLALVAMGILARELGAGKAAALLAAVVWAGGGWGLTALSFYHIVTVGAWWPLVLWGAARGGRGGIALGGLACGLALLGGEPLVAALGCAPLALVAVSRHGWKRGLATAFAVAAAGLVVALPQVVATLRILPFTFRGGAGVPLDQASLYSFHPMRLVELVLPLPFGWPTEMGVRRFWAQPWLGRTPLILSLYPGIVAFTLALAGLRSAGGGRRDRRSRVAAGWALLAAAGLVLAWLGGVWSQTLLAVTAGLFRFPEKFLLWPALSLPLLAAFGLERVLDRPQGWVRGVAVGAASSLVLALLLQANSTRLVALLEPLMAGSNPPGTARAQVGLWAVALLAAAGLLALAAWAGHRRWPALLVGLEIAALLQLFPLLPRDSTAPYREPSPWARRLRQVSPSPAVVSATVASPFYDPSPPYVMAEPSRVAQMRLAALDLHAAPGVLYGLRYPMAPDVDGLFSPLTTLMLYNLPFLDEAKRTSWLRALGVEAIATTHRPREPGLELLDEARRHGVPTYLLRVEGTAPEAWWPRSLVPAAHPPEAFGAVSRAADPVAEVVVPRAIAHDPEGSVELLAASPDHLELEVASGGGGVMAVRRAYQPLLAAELVDEGDRGPRLETLPVNLHLLGIVVPPGRHRIRVAVSAAPEIAAAAVAVPAALLLAVIGGLAVRRARQPREEPEA